MQNNRSKFSPDNSKHIVVKYHYIEDQRDDRKAFHSCSIKEFERQVAFLKNNFEIRAVADVFEAAQKKIPVNMCALTFDDGLKDQYQNAFPVLNEHGVRGSFFPITRTLEGFLPATHAMHVVLSLESAESAIDLFNDFLKTSYPDLVDGFFVGKTKRITISRKMYDDIPTANLKETMNRIPREVRDCFLDRVFDDLCLDKEELARELFMSTEEIKELCNAGHNIGSHSHGHEAFDTEDKPTIAKEIRESKEILEKVTGGKITELVYPQSTPKASTEDILRAEGILYALGTERRGVVCGDNPYRVPRYDANDIRDFVRQSTF